MTICKPLFISLTLLSAGTSCFALQTYPLVDHQNTTLTISDSEHNRIAVLGDRIYQIFGADGAFDVQSDEEGGQIFIRAQAQHFKPIPVTIITESGLTQDLKLIPKSIESQSILFKPANPSRTENNTPEERLTHLSSLMTLMKTMVEDRDLKDYTKMSLAQNDRRVRIPPVGASPTRGVHLRPLSSGISLSHALKVDPLFLYKGESIEGKVYTLTNQGKETISLIEPDFALKNDLAIAFEKVTLSPNEQSKLYVISRHVSGRLVSEKLVSKRPVSKRLISGRQS